MRNEIAIVTTYQREELLWLSLEALRVLHADLRIYVFSDRGADTGDLRETCSKFEAIPVAQIAHGYYGNSYNLLDAIRWALREFPLLETVHLVEDDTLVHRCWLTWADQQLRSGEYACACARYRYPQHLENWYASPAASWNASHLRQALDLVDDGYFCSMRAEMQKWIDAKFPQSRYKGGGAEQDGFFLRCIEKFGWKSKFPNVSMCSHLGFAGYNAPPGRKRPEGDLAQRVQFCRDLTKDRQRRIELFGEQVTRDEMAGEMENS